MRFPMSEGCLKIFGGYDEERSHFESIWRWRRRDEMVIRDKTENLNFTRSAIPTVAKFGYLHRHRVTLSQ